MHQDEGGMCRDNVSELKWREVVFRFFMLTSVSHEDFQSGVLQQKTSGEHSPDLTEHPFTMQTLCVSQYLFYLFKRKRDIFQTFSFIFLLNDGVTCPHFGVRFLEGRILFVHLKVDFRGGDGERSSSHHDRSHQLSRRAQNHRAWGGGREGGQGHRSAVLNYFFRSTESLMIQRCFTEEITTHFMLVRIHPSYCYFAAAMWKRSVSYKFDSVMSLQDKNCLNWLGGGGLVQL